MRGSIDFDAVSAIAAHCEAAEAPRASRSVDLGESHRSRARPNGRASASGPRALVGAFPPNARVRCIVTWLWEMRKPCPPVTGAMMPNPALGLVTTQWTTGTRFEPWMRTASACKNITGRP